MNPQPESTTQQWPRLRLDFYNTAVLMSRWEDDGRVSTYPVSVHDVVSACTNVQLSSGLLPPNTLFWKQQAKRRGETQRTVAQQIFQRCAGTRERHAQRLGDVSVAIQP